MRATSVSLALLIACGSDHHAATGTDASSDATTDASSHPGVCGRTAPPDGARHIVVSKLYTAASNPANTYEVLTLTAAGELVRPATPVKFDMGRAAFGVIAFTPDGKLGFAPQSDGKIGVFSLADDGTPTVINAAFDAGAYASRVVMDPGGDYAYVIDPDTRANHGGIYAVQIGCDNTLTPLGLIAAGSTPNGLVIDGDRAFVAAGAMLDSATGVDLTMLTWPSGTAAPTVTAGADAFGDDKAIVGGTALSADKKTFFIGDTNGFSGIPNRVAVVKVGGSALVPAGVLSPIPDPEAIVASPFGNVAIVSSTADGDAILVLDDGGTDHAWRVRGHVAYNGASPMLPADMAPITRGALEGHVLVVELSSIRQLAFDDQTNDVTDLGSLTFGDGVDEILGSIGITP